MVRFLASSVLFILSNAIGLLMAAWLIDGFAIQPLGFVVSVLIFSLVGILLEPFITKMAIRYIPALRGGIALVTVFVGLVITVVFTEGLDISGVSTWILAPLVIWLSVVLAGILLPLVLFKRALGNVHEAHGSRKSDDVTDESTPPRS